MASMGKSLGSMFRDTRLSAMLPPLPEGLGLPEKSNSGVIGRAKGEEYGGVGYERERAKAEKYNKAFADLLNNQPQLSGAERKEIYSAYSDKYIQRGPGIKPLTDFSGGLSQAKAMTNEQIAEANRPKTTPTATPAAQPQAAPTTAPRAPVTAAAQPQTVGPVAQPQETATPTIATASGNIAGQTTTTGAPSGARGRRGRMQTLLTGLGGAVERFGL